MARLHATLGNSDEAFEWLERLWLERGGDHQWIEERAYHSYYLPIQSDPRWDAFLEKVGVSDEQLATIPFEFTFQLQ